MTIEEQIKEAYDALNNFNKNKNRYIEKVVHMQLFLNHSFTNKLLEKPEMTYEEAEINWQNKIDYDRQLLWNKIDELEQCKKFMEL